MTEELFTRSGDGSYAVNLPPPLREFIRETASDLIPRVGVRDELTWRLFPTTHGDNAAREGEYRDLAASALAESRVAALELVRESVDRERLTADEMDAWMRAVGLMRLVVDAIEPAPPGTPTAGQQEMTRDVLSWLQGELVEALDPEYRELR
ncbi:MAG: DUF2017 family protein [Actinobacteria bacterium]|nr:DUF2017 family protein [Actinomycetota bacterium]